MILLKKILQELQWWQGVILRNQEMILEVRIPEAVMVSDASPKSWGVTPELQTGDTLVQHRERNKEQKHWTSNKKVMENIYLGLFRYGQIFKEQQIKAIIITSGSSTEIYDFAKQRTGQTLLVEVKIIVKLCQQLRIQTQIQHIPGVSNKITDALSRLSTQGDYSLKKRIIQSCLPGVADTSSTGLFRYTGKQTRGQIISIRRGRGRRGVVKRIFLGFWKKEIIWTPTIKFRRLEKR
ncbi:MAG: hypothetical protein EZS28_005985 [Streblomastix strix]|uniref:Uncharacterized protein n=1 Tax=Streblomastix strix TaxID=222440 RepID=A0A5J4WVV5_9EUKA|nr:MAG: hypothetical protein EZS28_005985 [Streblomastix strix]